MELRLHVYETLWYLLVMSLCALHRRQSLCAGVLVLLQLKWAVAKGGIGGGGTMGGGGTRESGMGGGGTRESGTGEGGTGGSRTRGGGTMGGGGTREGGTKESGTGEVGQGEAGRWGGGGLVHPQRSVHMAAPEQKLLLI